MQYREMAFQLKSKSKTDEGEVSLTISEWGGMMGCTNNMGKPVGGITVGPDGGGYMITFDKFGYAR